jgi:hypothetical protein
MKLTRTLLVGFLAVSKLSFSQPMAPIAVGNTSKGEVKPSATIASVTQGLKKYEGYFTFYYDEKTGKVLLEVDKLDKEFLYFRSLSN